MKEIRIIGDDGVVIIQVFGYERSTFENTSDANWLSCRINIDIPPFLGRYDASFTTQDFYTFGKELTALSAHLHGQAVFETDEGALRLRLKMHARGALVIEGEAVAMTTARSTLKFTIHADQSYLGELRRAVAAVSTEFPTRTVAGSDGGG